MYEQSTKDIRDQENSYTKDTRDHKIYINSVVVIPKFLVGGGYNVQILFLLFSVVPVHNARKKLRFRGGEGGNPPPRNYATSYKIHSKSRKFIQETFEIKNNSFVVISGR